MFRSDEHHETHHHHGLYHGRLKEIFRGPLSPLSPSLIILFATPFLSSQLVIPMELFKELICFLRVMLESEDMAHNDIALGALHKIFYISYSVSAVIDLASPLVISMVHL
jgi:hypothetical protein